MEALSHRHLLTLKLTVDAPGAAIIGSTGSGLRSIVPVVSGTFAGERLSGRVLHGADWVLAHGDSRMEIDVRLIMETGDGAKIYLTYQGEFRGEPGALPALARGEVLADDSYSLSTRARFECGDKRYSWLNDVHAVGTGTQSGFNPTYQLFEIAPLAK